MVYDNLMIRNNTVSSYNTNRSRPVTVQCIYPGVSGTGRPASVDRDDLPQPCSELGSDYICDEHKLFKNKENLFIMSIKLQG